MIIDKKLMHMSPYENKSDREPIFPLKLVISDGVTVKIFYLF